MSLPQGQRLFIDRQHLSAIHIGADPDAPAVRSLLPGQARLVIESFALTANNITYAAFGQAMKYWQFFPAPKTHQACLPVWGFARVAESQAEGLAAGQRIYGYLPAGSHLVVQPSRVSARGFTDSAAHREGLAAVYNQYSTAPASAQALNDGLRAVLQPLFMTAFLLDDFFADNQYFGAQQLLLSSASSKTAVATAHCLSLRRNQPGEPQVLGLTSAGNRDYTESLGLYDRVLTYGEVGHLEATTPTAYVDFAGSATVRGTVHHHFRNHLVFSSAIGGTHWTDLGQTPALPGPRPALFFAPSQAAARSAPPPQGWGRDLLEHRLSEAWQRFAKSASMGVQPWVDIQYQTGPAALSAAYMALLNGHAQPRQGLMLSLQ
jgi:hypothetical protein